VVRQPSERFVMGNAWRMGVMLLALLVGAGFCGSAQGGEVVSEFRLGFLEHDSDLFGTGREQGLDINLALLFGSRVLPFSLPPGLPGELQPFLGLTTQGKAETADQVYAGLGWNFRPEGRYLVRLGMGIAGTDGEQDTDDENRLSVGQPILFYGSFEAGLRVGQCSSFSLFYQHSSNGPLSGPNNGIDNFGVRYGYHFGEAHGDDDGVCR